MKNANEFLFKKLADVIDCDSLDLSRSIKYITSTPEDKMWLKSVKFLINEDLFIDRHSFFALAEFEGQNYILQIGFGPAINIDEDLLLIPDNGGIFVALVADLDLPMLDRDDLKLNIQEEIFLPSNDGDKVGFYFQEISKFFVKYFIYKINPDSTLLNQDNRLTLQKSALYLLSFSLNAIYLKTSEKTLESVRFIARLDVDLLPFDRVFRAFIERRYEHAFLDLYRCIEMLFSLKKIDELKARLNLVLKHLEISADVEAALGWRPVEKSALSEIVNQLPTGIIEALQKCFKNDSEICTNIYSLRNECVHFRPLQRKSSLTKEVKWMELLESMTLTIHHAYHINYRQMF